MFSSSESVTQSSPKILVVWEVLNMKSHNERRIIG
jgi:hypothetical protein